MPSHVVAATTKQCHYLSGNPNPVKSATPHSRTVLFSDLRVGQEAASVWNLCTIIYVQLLHIVNAIERMECHKSIRDATQQDNLDRT